MKERRSLFKRRKRFPRRFQGISASQTYVNNNMLLLLPATPHGPNICFFLRVFFPIYIFLLFLLNRVFVGFLVKTSRNVVEKSGEKIYELNKKPTNFGNR